MSKDELLKEIERLKLEIATSLAIREERRRKNIYQSGREIPLSPEDKLRLAMHIQIMKMHAEKQDLKKKRR